MNECRNAVVMMMKRRYNKPEHETTRVGERDQKHILLVYIEK
jgi:hypothetical protein